MASTTIAFRVAPPLYGINGASFLIREVADLEEVTVKVTLVDSGAAQVQAVTSGSGSVTVMGDSLGILHNTRLDVTVPGTLPEWMTQRTNPVLARVTNRLIDWYRLIGDKPFVRRIPLSSVGGFQATDESGEGSSLLGWAPGDASTTAGGEADDLVTRLAECLGERRELPLWAVLYLDACAEYQAGELRAAVLFANSSMETLVNRSFRAVVEPAEVDEAFAVGSPTSFWRLLRRVNAIVGTGLSNTRLQQLAEDVHQYRDDVVHGNPVHLDEEIVGAAVTALRTVGWTLDSAVVRYLAR